METYSLKPQAIALSDGWDVIVLGGGPSGCTAAVAAAREGARTLLLEATNCLGGMGTAGLVPAWCPFSDKEKSVYRGLAQRVFDESRKGVPHEPSSKLDWVAINPEHLKRVYDDLVTGAGVHVLFHAQAASVQMRADGEVDAVLVATKAGLTAYRARVYVDSTGDGDVATWAGAPFAKGDAATGELQPATMCFQLANVTTFHYLHSPTVFPSNKQSPVYSIVGNPKYPHVRDAHMCQNEVGPNVVGFNAGHVWDADNTDPEKLTQAIFEGRKVADELQRGLAEFHPKAFGGSFLAATGALLGIRESRRIEGDYVLTAEDYAARRSFDDEIGRNSYFIDIHTAKAEVAAANAKREWDELVVGRFEHYGAGESHGIPYRCLTPKGLRNVVVSGRCISTDRPVQGSTRVMPACLVTGEAAGLAAALAARAGQPDVHAVDTAHLRRRLREEGAYLP